MILSPLAVLTAAAIAAVSAPDAGAAPDAGIRQGSLSKDAIVAVIREHQNEIKSSTAIKYCYEWELRRLGDPHLVGKVTVKFTIEPNGSVPGTEIVSTLNNVNVETCMGKRIRGWKFPKPEGGGPLTVSYPWTFKTR